MGHIAGIILGHGGKFGAAEGWGFRLGHGSLQGGLEDLGFGEILEGKAQSANAGNGDGTVPEKPSEERFQDEYSLDVFQGEFAGSAGYESSTVNETLVGQGDLGVPISQEDDDEV